MVGGGQICGKIYLIYQHYFFGLIFSFFSALLRLDLITLLLVNK